MVNNVVDVKCSHNPPFDMSNIHNMVVNGTSYWVTLCDDCVRIKDNARTVSKVGSGIAGTPRQNIDNNPFPVSSDHHIRRHIR